MKETRASGAADKGREAEKTITSLIVSLEILRNDFTYLTKEVEELSRTSEKTSSAHTAIRLLEVSVRALKKKTLKWIMSLKKRLNAWIPSRKGQDG